MVVFKTVREVRDFCQEGKSKGKSIGLVPTMGALHEGHVALVKKSLEENGITVVSIFINPSQFNNRNDLNKYPRNMEADIQILKGLSVDCIFAPDVNEMYPAPDERLFNFGSLDKTMEGRFRPNHFNGVAKIVSRLFQITEPDRAYFGEKDFQQLVIIKHLAKILNYDTVIVPYPTVREKTGLAQSSRNKLLTGKQRANAAVIYLTLMEAAGKTDLPVSTVRDWVIGKINENPHLDVEYFEIADRETLQPSHPRERTGNGHVGCIAVKAGEVRLIDNILFNK